MQAQVDFLKHLLDPECTLDWKVKYNVHHLCHQKMNFVKQCITDVIQENDIQLTPFGIYAHSISQNINFEKNNYGPDCLSL